MPDTYTATYNFTKPEVNASRDTWGTKWNANIDQIDTLLKSLSDNKIQYNPTDKTSSADVNFIGVRPKVNGKRIVTTDFIPVGTIVMWWGQVANIPPGWALCNGQNGTPNMIDRFPVCAGSGYPVGSLGGATSHAHGIHGTALSIAQMPWHNHQYAQTPHNHYVNDPGHTHDYRRARTTGYSTSISSGSISQIQLDDGVNTASNRTGIWLNDSYANIQFAAEGGGQAHSHGMDAADHRPPWFGVLFIMKLAATATVD